MLRTRQPAPFRRYRNRAEPRFRQRRRRPQPHPLLSLHLSSRPHLRWSDLLARLPELTGRPICVRDRAQLRVHRGKLLSRSAERGVPVYAACFVRDREIVLETELLAKPGLFRFILAHELFHFVWVRLGNLRRAEFSAIIRQEQAARARGELGESSAVRKERVGRSDCLRNSRAWRNYVCESFCDTAAWFYSGMRRNLAFTLPKRWRDQRAAWFRSSFGAGCSC